MPPKSPRTIFAYFDSKEDIVLCKEVTFLETLKHKLDERPSGTTTVDALRDFLSTIPQPDEQAKLRKQIFQGNPSLQMRMRGQLSELEPMLAESIATDLGADPDDIRPLPHRRLHDGGLHGGPRPLPRGGIQ